MASQLFNNFKNYATQLERELGIKYDAKPYKETIRAMLDGYCKALDEGDEHLKNLYISGLLLRHWDKVKKLALTCPNIDLQGEEFVEWVYEAIMYACKYRKWQKDDRINAQQCINQCIETIRKQHYYNYNLDKNRLVEAIIVDIIAFGDAEKITKHVKYGVDENGEKVKYTTYTREFWKFKAVQILSNLSDDYQRYFSDNYLVNKSALDSALNMLKKANNQKLYKQINSTLDYARSSLKAFA